MHLGIRLMVASAVLLGIAVGGCGNESTTADSTGKNTDKPAKDTVSPEAMAKAQDVYKKRCAVCHGETGKSDGPQAATLKPSPAKFTDSRWQLATSDTAIEAIIKKGGSAVGKSLLMPPNPDLADDTIKALRILVREFGQ